MRLRCAAANGMRGRRVRTRCARSWAAASALLLVGCSGPLRPVFPPIQDARAWPEPPEASRIRYVGALSTSADLKPSPKPFSGLSNLLVGPAKPDPLYGPRSIVSSEDGKRIWVADVGGRCLHLLDLDRRVYRKVTRVGEASLLAPVDVCRGPGSSLFVCDSEAVAVHRISAESGDGLGTLRIPEDLQRPAAVYWDDAARELFVADTGAHDIKVLNENGALLRIFGKRGAGPGEFNFPCDLIGDGESLWVVDAGNHRVQRISPAGEVVGGFGQAGDALGDLALPKGVALDGDGHVYVVDARFENVQIFDRSGQLLLAFGEEGSEPGQFWLPAGIHIDAANRIWVCDTYNGRIQVFEYLRSEAP